MATARTRARGDNLPADLSSFVGRRRELSSLKRSLAASRIVTLTGVGGVGKTRLALRVARQLARDFPDGVHLVALDQLTDPDLVDAAVAGALGLRVPVAGLPRQALCDYLAGRRLLLVLDNCEHLREACAALVGSLVPGCPGVRILATSREPLQVPGENAVTAPALSVPERDDQPALGALTQYEAICLFADRAAAVDRGFALTEANRAAVVAICRRLDGLPLAIELAAARLRAMTPAEILHRLDDRCRLLSKGIRGRPPRQQTLKASIEWSFTLCSPAEQRLWTRLAVFSGGFETDAVREVCADDAVSAQRVPELLAALADKSILVAEQHRFGTRHRMLETIAEYARARLDESGERDALRRRHRDWCERLALRMHAEWISDRQEYWLDRMHREHPNLRAALDACRPEPEAALRILVALPPAYLWARDLLGEIRRRLDRALAGDPPPTATGARALVLAGQLAIAQGDLAASAPLLARGRELARRLDDRPALAFAGYAAGNAAMYAGDPAGALAEFAAGLTVSGGLPTLNQRLDLLLCMAIAAGLAGDEPRAAACYEEILALTDSCDELFNRANALWALGLALWRRGEPARAADLQRDSLQLKWRIGDRLSAALSVEAIAWIAADRAPERAATVLGVAEALWHAGGTRMDTQRHLVDDHDHCVRTCRTALGDPRFDAAVTRGRSLPPDEGLAYALDERTARRRTRTATDPAALTRRQAEAAALIAKGLTDQEIGRAMGISTRTAESHVEAILTKLGFTSRAQVAAWVDTGEPATPA
jgi:predicted ATPase/DNA-binding CsgD family transcriptional regulator